MMMMMMMIRRKEIERFMCHHSSRTHVSHEGHVEPTWHGGGFFYQKSQHQITKQTSVIKKKVGPARVFWRVKKIVFTFYVFFLLFQRGNLLLHYSYLLLCWKEMIVVVTLFAQVGVWGNWIGVTPVKVTRKWY